MVGPVFRFARHDMAASDFLHSSFIFSICFFPGKFAVGHQSKDSSLFDDGDPSSLEEEECFGAWFLQEELHGGGFFKLRSRVQSSSPIFRSRPGRVEQAVLRLRSRLRPPLW